MNFSIYILFGCMILLLINKNEMKRQNEKKNVQIKLPLKREFQQNKGLQNYWPFKSNVNDVIGGAHLFDGVNASLTNDRFGKPLSALRLVNGYYKMPPGVYFNGSDYTVMSWVYPRDIKYWSQILEVSNGKTSDNIVFMLFNANKSPRNVINHGGVWGFIDSNTSLILKKWQHIAFVNSALNVKIYMDGNLKANDFIAKAPKNILRTENYIGRSLSYSSDPGANADLDEIKIFNRALNQQEIQFEMNNEIFY